jgi:hypothetical protein
LWPTQLLEGLSLLRCACGCFKHSSQKNLILCGCISVTLTLDFERKRVPPSRTAHDKRLASPTRRPSLPVRHQDRSASISTDAVSPNSRFGSRVCSKLKDIHPLLLTDIAHDVAETFCNNREMPSLIDPSVYIVADRDLVGLIEHYGVDFHGLPLVDDGWMCQHSSQHESPCPPVEYGKSTRSCQEADLLQRRILHPDLRGQRLHTGTDGLGQLSRRRDIDVSRPHVRRRCPSVFEAYQNQCQASVRGTRRTLSARPLSPSSLASSGRGAAGAETVEQVKS